MIPRVKEYKELGGSFSAATLLFPESEDGRSAARLLGIFLPAVRALTCAKPSAILVSEALATGAYRLSVTHNGVRVTYRD
ncbi:MAG: hypothetical protein J6T24_05590, partial [Clostridia bacterium]|nr:hypothetical protein [Clostridia bacterium]